MSASQREWGNAVWRKERDERGAKMKGDYGAMGRKKGREGRKDCRKGL